MFFIRALGIFSVACGSLVSGQLQAAVDGHKTFNPKVPCSHDDQTKVSV